MANIGVSPVPGGGVVFSAEGKRLFPLEGQQPLERISPIGPTGLEVISFLCEQDGDQLVVSISADNGLAHSDRYISVTKKDELTFVGITPNGECADELNLPTSKSEFPPTWSL